jgi:genome maintenance exonuclease 1
MYYPNKFTYSQLTREEIDGSRKYITPDGEKLPSVTTILKATEPPEKQEGLNRWRRTVGNKEAQKITATASGRGTRMHTWLEKYVKTGSIDPPGSHPMSIQSNSMATVIIENGLKKCNEFWGCEINLYYPSVYAGTTDLIGVYNGKPAIMDFKQTNKPKKREWIEDYFLQLVAYSNAHNVLYDTNIECGVIFMCSQDNKYQEFVIEGDEFQHWSHKWIDRLSQYYSL